MRESHGIASRRRPAASQRAAGFQHLDSRSGAKTTFAVRDIKMYEDGFIQTQSDGLSRLDIHDPWFMRSVEVTARRVILAV